MDDKKASHGGAGRGQGRKSTVHPEGPVKRAAYGIPEVVLDGVEHVRKMRGLNKSQAATEAFRDWIRKWVS